MANAFRCIWTLLKMRLAHIMNFRLSFFGAFFVDGSMFLLQLATFSAIYSQVDAIGGWGQAEMLIFIGTFSLINALNMVIFFFGLNDIPDKIKSGAMDNYLTKPGSALLRLTFESPDLGSTPLILLSILIIMRGSALLGTRIAPANILGYIALVLLMTLLWYDMEVILRTIPFFTISMSAVNQFEGEALEMCMKLPGRLFRGVWRIVFWFVLPYGIMSTLPTELLAGVLDWPGLVYGVGISVAFTWFALWLWKRGVKAYKSASS